MKKIVLLITCAVLLTSCGTSISTIKSSPDRYNDKDISIKGSIIKITTPPLIPVELLEVYDQTGKLLVVNMNKGKYRINDKVSLSGRLYALNNKNLGKSLQILEKKLINELIKKTKMNRKQAKSQVTLLFGLLKGFLKDKVNLMVMVGY